jgi:hypothetical protein
MLLVQCESGTDLLKPIGLRTHLSETSFSGTAVRRPTPCSIGSAGCLAPLEAF